MLCELHIKHFLLIDEARLEFDPGFNVITGETGAGKSILLDAFALLLGERASPQIVRPGTEEAYVEAYWQLAPQSAGAALVRQLLEDNGLEWDPDGLIIKRLIRADGRSTAYINGNVALLKVLKNLGELLVDIHGQHEHQSIFQRLVCQQLLDSYAGSEKMVEQIGLYFEELQRVREQLAELATAEETRRQRMGELREQIEEIEAVAPQPEEEESLRSERKLLVHAEQQAEAGQRLLSLCRGEDDQAALLDLAAQGERVLEDMARIDDNLQEHWTRWQEARLTFDDLADRIGTYLEQLGFSVERQEEINRRLYAFQDLKSKYGLTMAQVLENLEKMHAELQHLAVATVEAGQLAGRAEELEKELCRLGTVLSKERDKAAAKLSTAVGRELKQLGLERARFEVRLERVPDEQGLPREDGKRYRFTARGWEHAEFLLAANPGQPAQTLREAASGGEVSRIMLALKAVLAEVDAVPTLVFDEIDLGLGGETGNIVGKKLAEIAERRQLICITHLAGIAAWAEVNFRVSKAVQGKNTVTLVERLSGAERKQEIARMLSGQVGTAASEQLAEELLRRSAK